MLRRRFLPWEYGIRNLLRRPTRSLLTLCALATVVLLVLVVVGFIRGLERSLAESGDPDVVLVYSVTAEANIENSSIVGRTPDLLAASVEGVLSRYGVKAVSPELYFGTRVQTGDRVGLGLLRGVSQTAPMVRRRVRISDGKWPEPGEVLVGKLVATKLGCRPEALVVGSEITFEKKKWRISGHFVAAGSAFESEIWCRLPDLQQCLNRQDLSLVALLMSPGVGSADVEIFAKERTDLELQAVRETSYYEALQQHYRPVRLVAWMVVGLVAGAGVFAGLNMMYGAVAGRVREIATLQAIGYRRRAILASLVEEGALLAAAASLIAGLIALPLINGSSVRFTMGAFELRIDGVALLVGCGIGLALGVLGAVPPAIRVLQRPVAQSLKAI